MSRTQQRKINISKASEYTGFPVSVIRNAAHYGDLTFYRGSFSKHAAMWFEIKDLDEWMNELRVKASK